MERKVRGKLLFKGDQTENLIAEGGQGHSKRKLSILKHKRGGPHNGWRRGQSEWKGDLTGKKRSCKQPGRKKNSEAGN